MHSADYGPHDNEAHRRIKALERKVDALLAVIPPETRNELIRQGVLNEKPLEPWEISEIKDFDQQTKQGMVLSIHELATRQGIDL